MNSPSIFQTMEVRMAAGRELIENVPAGGTILSMEHITKIYDNGFVANNDVSFDVKKGEILGLVGENGAGKTTLMNVLFGQITPERGTIRLGGEEVHIKSPLDALSYGVGMVHQHFMLIDSLTVAENMVLGAETGKGMLFDIKEAERQAREVSEKYDLKVDPSALVKDLSVGYKQRVEILKMLLRGARLLLLDEPTAVLTPQETKELFRQLKKLKEQGFSFVFISHKLNEVKEICDRITVLRLGRTVGHADINDVTEMDISRMMVGRDVILELEKEKAQPKQTVLSLRDLSHVNKFGSYAFKKLNFDVRAGEILGVAGVEGNGQAELAETLTGLLPIQTGHVHINGELIDGMSIRERREEGVSMVHEDRMAYGVSRDQSIAENTISDRYYKEGYRKGIALRLAEIREKTRRLITEFGVKCDGPDAPVSTLSGGNIQKVVAAREFSALPKLLIAAHPTRGIDVGATELIRKKIISLRDEQDTAVLLFSADLNELLTVSDSIIVMCEGEIVAFFPDASSLNEQTLGEYMLGLKRMSPEEIGGVCHE